MKRQAITDEQQPQPKKQRSACNLSGSILQRREVIVQTLHAKWNWLPRALAGLIADYAVQPVSEWSPLRFHDIIPPRHEIHSFDIRGSEMLIMSSPTAFGQEHVRRLQHYTDCTWDTEFKLSKPSVSVPEPRHFSAHLLPSSRYFFVGRFIECPKSWTISTTDPSHCYFSTNAMDHHNGHLYVLTPDKGLIVYDETNGQQVVHHMEPFRSLVECYWDMEVHGKTGLIVLVGSPILSEPGDANDNTTLTLWAIDKTVHRPVYKRIFTRKWVPRIKGVLPVCVTEHFIYVWPLGGPFICLDLRGQSLYEIQDLDQNLYRSRKLCVLPDDHTVAVIHGALSDNSDPLSLESCLRVLQ